MTSGSPKVRVKEIADEVVEPVEALRALSASRPVEPPAAAPRRALLGEENPVNARVAERVLEKVGFAVDMVSSGWEAVQAAESHDYDVILLDCDTPAIGGYHTVMAIRERDGARRVPIVALTSHTMQWDRREREAAGIDGYIAKPIEMDAMAAVLARVVDNQPQSVAGQLLALDRAVLSKLRTLGSGDLTEVRALTDLFVTTATLMIERMRKACGESDLGTIALTAHSLRGSSGQIGAKRMEEISATIEALARAGTPNQRLEDLVGELGAAFERVRQGLRQTDLDLLLGEAPPGPAPEAANAEARDAAASDDVLVAEDDPLIARFLSSSLSGAGLRVTHVNNGEAALKAMQERQYGCVVLDINMPKLDGYGVLSEMRLKPSTQRTPVLILSLRSQEHDIVRAFDLGVDDYVTKPFSPLEVISRVKRLMRR